MSGDSKIEDKIRGKLSNRKQTNSLRSLRTESNLIDFCSNDYLGFAKNISVKACHDKGATGSRLISGNSKQFERIENKIAAFHNAPAGLIFNSGYDANIGLFSCCLLYTSPSPRDS